MLSDYVELQGAADVPSRVVGANIPYMSLIYLVAVVALLVIVAGFVRRIRGWGVDFTKSENRASFSVMMGNILDALSQRQMIRGFGATAAFHICIVWGLVVLALNSTLDALAHFLGLTIRGSLYVASSASADIFGLVIIVGLAGMLVVKFVVRPARQDPCDCRSAALLLAFLFACISGYFVEGARIAGQLAQTIDPGELNYEIYSSPIGWWVAKLYVGLSLEQILLFHRACWWVHALCNMAGLAFLPFSRLWHIVAAMFNASHKQIGSLKEIEDFENEESLGAQYLKNLKWTDLADLDACIECGACSVVCPANNAGYPLNPKTDIILSFRNEKRREKTEGGLGRDLREVIGDDALWSCATCRACVEACPLSIDHISKVVDVRRRVVLWDEEAPDRAQAAFINLDMNQNPWGMGYAARSDWVKRTGVEGQLINLAEQPEASFDYLLFAGCFAAFDLRYRRAAAASVRLLGLLGRKVAYLGIRESCCGDSARRLGNEFLYQELASRNIDAFKSCGASRIITLCPHCLNTLKNEYPRLDSELNVHVFHISEVLTDLLRDRGDLNLGRGPAVLVQEPCYLARYNPSSDLLVEALNAAGCFVVNEGDKYGPTCCGGGGGCMWLDDAAVEKSKRISAARLDALIETASKSGVALDDARLVSGCPYCMTMLDDALSERGDVLRASDVSEVLWELLKEKVE